MNAICTLLSAALVSVLLIATPLAPVETAWALPPRPTPAPTPAAAGSVNGGAIVLSLAWPASDLALRAQSVWTTVQWQAPSGAWYDVEGWQGTLDQVTDGRGEKTWWVYHADLGKGPFRWRVYQQVGGALLATSAPFHLPSRDDMTEQVAIQLTP